MTDAEGADVAPREGPPPRVDVRHRQRSSTGPPTSTPCAPGWSAAALEVPRLRWRVQPDPSDFGAPVWADDPDFDIDHHVRRIALPKPGTCRELFDLATLMLLDPFDRTRPLWQFIDRRGPARGQGGARAEDPPHDHRRRGRRADVAAVPRLRTRRRRPDRSRASPAADDSAPPPAPRRSTPHAACSRAASAAARPRPPGARAARRPGVDPARQRGHGRHAAQRRVAAVRRPSRPARRCGPNRSLRRRIEVGGRRSRPPRTPRSGSAARSTPPS